MPSRVIEESFLRLYEKECMPLFHPRFCKNAPEKSSSLVEAHFCFFPIPLMKRYISTPFSLLLLLSDALAFVLTLRFLFKLFGANTGNMFISWLYVFTEPMVLPFRNIFPPLAVPSLGVLEWSVLIASCVYSIVLLFVMRLLVVTFNDEIVTDEEATNEGEHIHHPSHI